MGADPESGGPLPASAHSGHADTGSAGYPTIAPYGTFPQSQPAPSPGSSQGFIPIQATRSAPDTTMGYYGGSSRLPFCGCGLGKFLFLLGFIFPIAWFIGAFVFFFVESINRDRREYLGLLGSTIAAGFVTLALLGTGGSAFLGGLPGR